MSGAPLDCQNLTDYLFSLAAIRQRCRQVFDLAQTDSLIHFRYHPAQLQSTVNYVAAVIQENYPDLQIPYHSRWRHFEAGGIDRMATLQETLPPPGDLERGRILYELGITSVLLDAGAGQDWTFQEPTTQKKISRSEGLAVASFHAFLAGAFSANRQQPLRADGDALAQMTPEALAQHFQVRPENPLVGLAGRASLLNRLGQAVKTQPTFFGKTQPRLGFLFDYMVHHAKDQRLPAPFIFQTVLQSLGEIWPGRLVLEGINLGDCWSYPPLQTEERGSGLIPFHKLSQWLSYSLVEPLEEFGIQVDHLDQLTGLAEYRNGGLFLDQNLIELKDPTEQHKAHLPESLLIIEWRALTVILLDVVAHEIRHVFDPRWPSASANPLPLAKILQGGTWNAGRKMAHALREGGAPPIELQSDGTVF